MAQGSVTALNLLDLSPASDIIDHTSLLDGLYTIYGISDLALDWIKSYLSERTHSVKVDSILSHLAELQFSVPQGFFSWSDIFFFSIQTQLAHLSSHTVVSSTISMPMIPNYT